jgi:hypothetical protein
MTLLQKIILPLLAICAFSSYAEESIFDIADDPDSEIDSVFSAADKIAVDKVATTSAFYDSAKIIALNKITANAQEIILKIGKTSYFHNAEIRLNKCWKSPDQYMPNNQILLDVVENKADEDAKSIFHGWLISSQPALATLEHPVYEIMAVECRGNPLNK